MVRHTIQRGLLAGMLLMSLTLLGQAHARGRMDGEESETPVSRGAVLTIVALNPKNHMATLRADDGGQEFQLPAYASWKVGAKVECDLVDINIGGQPGPQLQNCQPWS